MGMIIGGVVLAIIGGILWLVMGKKAGKLGVLENTETSSTKEVHENFTSMSDSFGAGNFSLFTELKGVAVASTPLEAELSKKECVYYKSKVTREYEEQQKSKDSDGNVTKKWVRKSEIVSSNENTATGFAIKDDSGEVLVDLTGAEIYPIKSFSDFEKVNENNAGGTKVSIGGFSLTTGGGNPTIRTIGYKYEEQSIPLNSKIYILGDANDRSGKLTVSKSKDKKVPFIVSTKSEDELTASLGSSVKGFKYGAFTCFGLGGVIVVWGIIKLILG
tara:strand:+ start:151 stop:972 length:822 start_codon:yes stop_codon:yes gene_type:complete